MAAGDFSLYWTWAFQALVSKSSPISGCCRLGSLCKHGGWFCAGRHSRKGLAPPMRNTSSSHLLKVPEVAVPHCFCTPHTPCGSPARDLFDNGLRVLLSRFSVPESLAQGGRSAEQPSGQPWACWRAPAHTARSLVCVP